MKITLEINTANVQDIIEAIDTLKPLLPKTESLDREDLVLNKDFSDKNESGCGINEEYDSLKEELEKTKSLLSKLEEERNNLLKENEEISEKLKELELNESLEALSIPDIMNEDKTTEEIEKLKQDYEHKIEELNKNVEFHENRSNKNFEEVKRLRALVDSVAIEKRNLEKKVNLLEKENEDLRELSSADNGEELNTLKEENKVLGEKLEFLEKTKEKLEKDVEFQKNRSKTNWDELKALRATHDNLIKENDSNKRKVDELQEKVEANSSNGDMEKLKMDFVIAKSDYENTISELRLDNDKLQNEINLYATKFSDSIIEELEHLKKIKGLICANEKGAAFWNGVENKIDQI